jgi:hypothetical protein
MQRVLATEQLPVTPSHLVSWYTSIVKVNVQTTSLAKQIVHKSKRKDSSMVSNNMELLVRHGCYECCVSVAIIL